MSPSACLPALPSCQTTSERGLAGQVCALRTNDLRKFAIAVDANVDLSTYFNAEGGVQSA